MSATPYALSTIIGGIIGAKLAGVITVPWFWLLFPLWIVLLVFALICCVLAVFVVNAADEQRRLRESEADHWCELGSDEVRS